MKKLWLIAPAFITFLICSCGNNNTPATNQPATTTTATASSDTQPAAKATGEDLYKKTCIACHQPNGAGIPNAFPPLAKSDYLADKNKTILQVLKGSSGDLTVNGAKYNNTMPPQHLSDEEIASVLTYVYGNFGNSGGTVTAAEVKAARAGM